jgi:SAM-dependent methyltransferase
MSDVNEALLGFELESATADERHQTLQRSNGHAMAQIAFSLRWQCENAQHHETLVTRKFNFWRDILPPALEADLLDRPVGHTAHATFAAGELLPGYRETDQLRIRDQAFDRRYRGRLYVEPRVGRFYPRGFIAGTRDIYPGDIRPFRVTSVDDERIGIELNHPLAGRELQVDATLLDIWAAGDEHGGRCEDVAEMLCNDGPGMQARWGNRPTDFFSDIPFSRPAPEPDAAFYAMPRLIGHVDRTAAAQIAHLYRELIPTGGKVLDLMSSVQSHLPQGHAGELIGLGMNAEEMAANPALDRHQVHDLNLQPQLPWDDASFDAAICSLSVEYLVKPFEVFAEVARVLKPGAPFVVTFSDRWFPPKVTHVWEGAHAFERPGIVLEYFLRDGLFGQLHTRSIRGLERPQDDPHAHQRDASDPVFAVWGTRAD